MRCQGATSWVRAVFMHRREEHGEMGGLIHRMHGLRPFSHRCVSFSLCRPLRIRLRGLTSRHPAFHLPAESLIRSSYLWRAWLGVTGALAALFLLSLRGNFPGHWRGPHNPKSMSDWSMRIGKAPASLDCFGLASWLSSHRRMDISRAINLVRTMLLGRPLAGCG